MKIARLIARILLGAGFTFAGASIFFVTPPPDPGMAGVFDEVFFKSHWALFVAAAQVVLGVMLLTNRYVPVALIILAAFVYNSFAFHITMAPSSVWAPILVLLLWLLVAMPYRRLFAPIFAARAQTDEQRL
ncbi:MAG: hypothetical protein M3N19_05885 [Candidatus Eremiobacteraeota bacterium]|nr:hypothetical protein [Candidatus Eremiobacteraeota bacterium]